MSIHTFKCEKCNKVFEDDYTYSDKALIYISGKWFDKELNEITLESPTAKCECGGIGRKLITDCSGVVWDDNLMPGSGYAEVTTRHEKGMDYDSKSARNIAYKTTKEMRGENAALAKVIKEKDDAKFYKEYRPVEVG